MSDVVQSPGQPWPRNTKTGLALVRVSPTDGASSWRLFTAPEHVLRTDDPEQVVALLDEADAAARDGRHVVGFLSYEAAPAFDPALRVHVASGGPLLWFGIYREALSVAPESEREADAASANLDWLLSMDQRAYDAAISRIKAYIAAGDTYQVNFTLRLAAEFHADPLALFNCLLAAQQARYAAYLDIGDGAICSVSPELFFRLDGDRLVFKPMKGTVRRGPYAAADQAQARWLRESPKNRAENLMIVDMIRNDASRIARPGTVQVPRLFEVERYPTLWQMTSTVTARTDASLPEILRATFPCASVTGAPKVRTMQIIDELEATPRGIYTGAIGYLAPNREAQFNVAIRTVRIDRASGQASYGAGGGIVADSDAAAEYAECRIKALVLTAAAQSFSLLETLRWTPEEGYFLLREHLDRLLASADYFDIPIDEHAVRDELERSVMCAGTTPQRVRLLAARNGRISIETTALVTWPPVPGRIITAALASVPVASAEVFLYHKTTLREPYQRPRAARPDCDDVLLWNERGEVTEFTTGNLIAARAGDLVTPPVASGLLAGTLRRAMLDAGQLRERVILKHELADFDALYFINSVRGQIPVRMIA